VSFTGASTAVISGSTSFYNFSCTQPGKTIQFQHLMTQTILAGGSFTAVGTSGSPITLTTDNPIAATNGSPPPQLQGQWVITNLSATPPNVNFATVSWSWATNPIIPGANVNDGGNNHDWTFSIAIVASWTLDTNNNGRIERIRVQVQPGITLNDSFGGLQVQVQGYTVTGFAAVGVNTDVFDILLNEGTQEDTNATPTWQVTANTTLSSAVGGALVAHNTATSTKLYVAASGARPVITYTLAALNATQAYVHFSEPVYGNNTATVPIGNTGFAYSGGAITVQPVEMSGNGAHAAIITFATPLAVNDILAGGQTISAALNAVWGQVYPSSFNYPTNFPSALQTQSSGNPGAYANTNLDGNLPPSAIAGPPYSGRAMLMPTSAPAAPAHNISDVGIGFVTAVLAQDQEITRNPVSGGIGMVTTFDGSQWLPAQNVFLEARIMPLSLSTATVTLYWDISPPPTLDFNNLWIPPGATTLWPGNLSGDRARYAGDSQARSVATSGISGALRDFIIPSTDPAIKDGALLQFMFLLNDGAGHVLPCALLASPSNPAGVQPFEFMFHAIVQQRGGVTVTNNVIRPDNGQTAFVNYTVSTPGPVTIMVFALSGSVVNVLQHGSQSPGQYSISWDGKNRGGRVVARGIYFIRVVGPGFDEIRKVLVVR
jgi:hypothetical protein